MNTLTFFNPVFLHFNLLKTYQIVMFLTAAWIPFPVMNLVSSWFHLQWEFEMCSSWEFLCPIPFPVGSWILLLCLVTQVPLWPLTFLRKNIQTCSSVTGYATRQKRLLSSLCSCTPSVSSHFFCTSNCIVSQTKTLLSAPKYHHFKKTHVTQCKPSQSRGFYICSPLLTMYVVYVLKEYVLNDEWHETLE